MALLFDLDGTLVETEPLWQRVQQQIVESLGGEWSLALNQRLIGNGLMTGSQILREATGTSVSVETIAQLVLDRMAEALAAGEALARPGADAAFVLARRLGLATAVVTSSYRVLAEPALRALPDAHPDALVTGEMVTRAKPDPEGYLLAARTLGVPIEQCVVVEDSAIGVEAALASGAHAVAVPNHTPIPTDPRLTVLGSLEDLTEDFLAQLLGPIWLTRAKSSSTAGGI